MLLSHILQNNFPWIKWPSWLKFRELLYGKIVHFRYLQIAINCYFNLKFFFFFTLNKNKMWLLLYEIKCKKFLYIEDFFISVHWQLFSFLYIEGFFHFFKISYIFFVIFVPALPKLSSLPKLNLPKHLGKWYNLPTYLHLIFQYNSGNKHYYFNPKRKPHLHRHLMSPNQAQHVLLIQLTTTNNETKHFVQFKNTWTKIVPC